jgi:hypothetical protein
MIFMPSISTHLYIGQKVLDNNNKLDKNYFLSGSIFPDIYYFFKKENNVSDYWHEKDDKNKIGVDFGYKLIKNSNNIKELSFSLGFLSHFLVDKKVHNYLRENNMLKNYKHQIIENFLSIEHNTKIPFLRYPKSLLLKSFKNQKSYKKQIDFNFCKKTLFLLKIKIVNWAIYEKYKKKKNNFVLNLLLNIIYSDFPKKYRQKVIFPDYSIKQKHLKEIKKKITSSEKEINKVIKKEI